MEIKVNEKLLSIVNEAMEFYQETAYDGNFASCLFKLIEKANEDNIVKLALAFPEEVYCYMIYAFGDNRGYFESIGLEFKLVQEVI